MDITLTLEDVPERDPVLQVKLHTDAQPKQVFSRNEYYLE